MTCFTVSRDYHCAAKSRHTRYVTMQSTASYIGPYIHDWVEEHRVYGVVADRRWLRAPCPMRCRVKKKEEDLERIHTYLIIFVCFSSD